MSLRVKSSILIATLLILLSIYSYGSFTSFKPKTLIPAKEVKGTESDEEGKIKLPYPENYKVIGRTQKNGNEHITYKTTRTPEEIQTFYRNVLISKEWEIDATGNAGIFTTTRYKFEDNQIDITTSQQSNEDQADEKTTIVSLLIKN